MCALRPSYEESFKRIRRSLQTATYSMGIMIQMSALDAWYSYQLSEIAGNSHIISRGYAAQKRLESAHTRRC